MDQRHIILSIGEGYHFMIIFLLRKLL